jgi:hypothetical protein
VKNNNINIKYTIDYFHTGIQVYIVKTEKKNIQFHVLTIQTGFGIGASL